MSNIKKIIEYGLYLLVFILPIQTRWIIKAGELNGGYWEYGTIGLYVTDVLLLALLLVFTINLFFKSKIANQKSPIKNYWRVIAGLELFVFISIFFAADKVLAVYKYGVFLLGVGLFWLVVSANYNRVKLIFSLLAGILAQAILGIWQFLTQSSFSSKWLGMAAHKAGNLGTSVIETVGTDGVGERWLRAYGGLDHPNMLGGLLMIGVLLAIILFLETSGRENHSQSSKPQRKTQGLFFCYLLFVACLFFTFSRGAWLGLTVGFVVILALLIWKKDFVGLKRLTELVLVGGAVIFLLFNLYGGLAKTRLALGARLEKKSYVERVSSMKDAKKIIEDKWLFGAGMGNYTLKVYDNEEKSRPSFYFQPAHNVFLLVWAEIGLFGLSAFLALLGFLGWQTVKSKTNFYGLPVLASLVVIMLVDHWLWSLHFGVLFFWLIAGLLLKEAAAKRMYDENVI